MKNKLEDKLGDFLVFILGASLLAVIVFIITLIVRFFCEMFFNPLGFMHPEENSNVGYWIFGILLYIVLGLIIIAPIDSTQTPHIKNNPRKRIRKQQSYDTSYFVDPDFDYNGDYGIDE